MGWQKKKNNLNKLPPFVALTWSLLNGKAYKDLPPSAAKALPYFLGKVKSNPNNPNRYWVEFSFSYTEANKLGFAFGTFSKIIQDLVSFGFIDPIDKGGLRSECKSCSVFKLSRRWELYGTNSFELLDWKCFIPKPR
jgi:hypothetical protein